MRIDNKQARGPLAIFDGADKGHHDLPKPLYAARARLLAIADQADGDLPPAAESLAVEQLARALADGTGTADAAPILALRSSHEEYAARSTLYRRAGELAAGELHQTVTDHCDVVIADFLAPAVAEVVAELAKLAPALALLADGDPRSLITAGKAAGAAWLRCEELCARYDAARSTRAGILALAGDRAERDEFGIFAEVENTADVWPELLSSRLPVAQLRRLAPWPAATKERLLWFGQAGGKVWCPTREQQDRAWLLVFGERLEQTRQNQHAAAGWRALGDSLGTGTAVHATP